MHTQPFHGNISFNAHHAPMGAYFTFTCGHVGTRGGMAAQLGKPASQDLYVGVKLGGRHETGAIRCLPFFDGAQARMQDAQTAYTLEKPGGETDSLSAYHTREMRRHYSWVTDTWKAGRESEPDFEFSIFTPFAGIPEPGKASPEEMRAALRPGVSAEMVIDNRQGTETKTGFFAINFNEGGARILDEGLPAGRVGFAWRAQYGVAAEAIELSDDNTCCRDKNGCSTITPFAIMRWSVQQGLEDRSNPVHLLGTVPGVGVEVPAGKRVILRLALGCYLDGVVTTRLEGKYLYTRHYSGLTDVLNASLDSFKETRRAATALNQRLENSKLNRDQQFLIAHATRSYYGNTQLLEVGGQPYWIVNEGEYCMMNTLDLSVDQMFWELDHNPWVVRNLLDNFVKRYSYTDQVKLPSAPHGNPGLSRASQEDAPTTDYTLAPGGISFAHDQGAHNQFSPFGQSSYELKDLTGCFSYMTQEQLCNWILMAASYVARTDDVEWARKQRGSIVGALQSMCNRDMPRGVEGASGIMRTDSDRCGTGQEITTYDSLDASLGQARNNLYLGVKCLTSYQGLQFLLHRLAEQNDAGDECRDQIMLAIDSIKSQWKKEEWFPAIFEGQNAGAEARILSAIEALIYPLQWRASGENAGWAADFLTKPQSGDEYFARTNAFVEMLRKHTVTLLSDPNRRNHFPDQGIRLSSTSDNSWLSKIALVQHVARTLFNLDENGQERPAQPSSLSTHHSAHGWEKSDAAHVKWLTEGESAFWAASDQFINGVAKGSRYYPRLITTALWLHE